MLGVVIGAAPTWAQEWADIAPYVRDAAFAPVNAMLAVWPGRADVFATLHPEKAAGFLEAAPNKDPVTVSIRGANGWFPRVRLAEAWGATSGLYAAQALMEWRGCDRVVLVGCPLDADAGATYLRPGRAWGEDASHVARYRSGALRAKQEAGDYIRSCSGWTKDLFGAPNFAFLSARRVL